MRRILWFLFSLALLPLMVVSCYLDVSIQCDDAAGLSCATGFVCQDNRCVCPTEQTACPGTQANTKECVNLNSNPSHCGSCGALCQSGLVCNAGKCSTSCSDGGTVCNGACVSDFQTNNEHCGKCGNKCEGGKQCVSGTCECTGTKPGTCDNVCVDLANDTKHCGACGKACSVGQACVNGNCGTCDESVFLRCDGTCISTPDLKLKHCGKCNTACTGTDVACCGDKDTQACLSLTTDDNCGACGNKCSAGSKCVDKKCACDSGFTACAGDGCVDVKKDAKHCGACGVACGSSEDCVDGKCCSKGSLNCGGVCIDVQTSLSHCGGCNTPCDKACVSGSCKACTDDTSCAGKYTCNTGTGACECAKGCNWAIQSSGEKGSSKANGIVVDDKNNSYIVGTFSGNGIFGSQKVESRKTSKDIFLLKLNAGGDVVWVKTWGGDAQDEGKAIAINKANDTLAITGSFASAELTLKGTTYTNQGNQDIFVMTVKASDGSVIWSSSPLKGAGNDYANGIAFNSNGDIIITGSHKEAVEFGGTSKLPASTNRSLYLAKYLKDMATNWSPSWAQSAGVDSEGHAVAIGSNDSIYVTGSFSENFDQNGVKLTSTGSSDLFVAKFNNVGEVQWAEGSLGTATGLTIAVKAGSTDQVFLAGNYQGGVGLGINASSKLNLNGPTGAFGAFVAKLDGDKGTFTWKMTPKNDDSASTGSSSFTGLVLYGNDEIAVTGYFNKTVKFSDGITLKAGTAGDEGDRSFIANFKDGGSPSAWQAAKQATSTDQGASRGHGIAADSQQSLYSAGYFSKNITFPISGAGYSALGSEDSFVWKDTLP